MKQLILEIKKERHSEESIQKYEDMLTNVQSFFEGKQLNPSYKSIDGIKVSDSGCNVWLIVTMVARPGGRLPSTTRQTYHTIYTTQNSHLAKFGFPSRRTDLERFVK